MLGRRAEADPGAVAALASRCDGLPLALRIAAELFSSHPAGQLAGGVAELSRRDALLDLLATGDDPYSAVRTVFFWSYRALPDPVAMAFRLLSLHPGSAFGLPVAAALLNMSAMQANVTLRTLVNAHLLTETAVGRFEMHDLLRLYAQELCARLDDDGSRRDAEHRMFDQYLHTAGEAARTLMPHRYRIALDGAAAVEPEFGSRTSARLWFDAERHNLVGMCRLPGAELDRRRWQPAFVLRDYFYLSKHLDGWLETHRLAVSGCERLGDDRAEGLTRNNFGRALLEAGQMDAAAAQYGRAYDLFRDAGDTHGMTDAMFNMTSILRRRGAYAEALRDQFAALAFYRRAGLERKIGISLRSISATELALGQLTEATEHAEEALSRFVGLGLDLDAAQSLVLLAEIYNASGDFDRAQAAGQRAIDFSRTASSDYEEARALHRLGAAAARAGLPHQARQQWTEALAILSRLGAAAAETVRSELQGLPTQSANTAVASWRERHPDEDARA
jgi:tetratricopeptide (TPR) repeat protein